MNKPVNCLQKESTEQIVAELPEIVEDTIKAIGRVKAKSERNRALLPEVVHYVKNGYGFKAKYGRESFNRIKVAVSSLAYWRFLDGWTMRQGIGFVKDDEENDNQRQEDLGDGFTDQLKAQMAKWEAKIRKDEREKLLRRLTA